MVRKTRKRRCQVRSGAAATELALWLPFLGLMFAVTLDFARIFHCSQTVQNCAWAGAMYASGTARRQPDDATDEAAAFRAALAEGTTLRPPLAKNQVTVTIDSAAATASVTVSYDFVGLIRWPGVTGTRTVQRTVTMNLAPRGPGQ